MEGQGAAQNNQGTVQNVGEGVDPGHQEALDHRDGELRVPEEAGGQHAQEAGGGH